MGKARPRVVTCFAKGYTACDTGVWVPASVASVLPRAVTTDLFGKPLMEAMDSHASTLFARPVITDKLMAVWLPKFVFPSPVPLLCWKADFLGYAQDPLEMFRIHKKCVLGFGVSS